jgi:hypothetical protein
MDTCRVGEGVVKLGPGVYKACGRLYHDSREHRARIKPGTPAPNINSRNPSLRDSCARTRNGPLAWYEGALLETGSSDK